ncbi:methionyl-tRNA formyltransferase [Desulfohalotomaculum tongense]|uniref:methionyl-tRNA formyltransferase n=1 Tax=Desulforadius tongensis TaxID=1216062 RepID=UPI00195ECB5F|nr:methionyl-tRNA formyltransferase [Desulforadius tongensis]MBM7855740.1 methionyl-tRNA formyltransferase [Desulforadius tongensis]
MRIVYMGTPDFAVPCLEKIMEQKHHLLAVITQPDRPKGRGKKLQPPPVKVVAESYNLPVYQPEKIKTAQFLQTLKELNPELIVVVAYGKILPKEILDLPPLGCVNVHASLLPKYRGAAPIHWAVINGEKETGVTTMYMNEGMDTGDMILSKSIPIDDDDTVGEVHDRLAALGAEVLGETLTLIASGSAPRVPQDHSQATYAPILKREHELINWNRSAREIKNQIRGMNPWPGTYTKLEGRVLKIWRAEIVAGSSKEKPGTVISSTNDQLVVQTGAGCLSITELQLQGSKRLGICDFLRGRKVPPGTVLGAEGGNDIND